MFEIRERFPNLHTINVTGNKIESLCGIDDIIKATPTTISLPSSSSSSSSQSLIRNRINLRNLLLDENPVLTKIEPKDKATLLALLHTFNGISNLGKPIYSTYDPDVEHVLRINHAGRKYITMEGGGGGGGGGREIGDGDGEISLDGTTKSNINQALWPLILERAYKKSHEIYSKIYVPRMYNTQKYRDTRKCATGLFDLVHHYWPIFMDRRYCGRWDESINNDKDNDNDNRQTQTKTKINAVL
jgi:hypothetical protein